MLHAINLQFLCNYLTPLLKVTQMQSQSNHNPLIKTFARGDLSQLLSNLKHLLVLNSDLEFFYKHH